MIRGLLALALLSLAPPPQSAVPAKAKAFDELLLRFAGSGWSGSVLVVQKGEVRLAGGYGFADFGADRPNGADTLFEIASISKSFTGVAVVKLAQQKKLGLDDPIAKHLPGVPEHSRAITLRHLLTHTSGIPRGNASGRGEDLERAVVEYLGSGPKGKPGAKYDYWNGGYALLAGVIERASGRSYTQYLEQELFLPAGMASTGFTGDTDLDPARDSLGISSQGEARRALEHPYGSYGYQYRGMGGIVTTVEDLARWDRALAKRTLLDEAHERELFQPFKDGYALGWRIGRAVNGAVRQSHGGGVRGFVSEFRRYPADDACIAVLCNRDDFNPNVIADDLECLLFGRSLAHELPKIPVLQRALAEACAGSYACAMGTVVVRDAPGVLMAGIEGETLLERLEGPQPALEWKANRAELAQRAAAIVEGIAKGDLEPLKKHVAARIPSDWPEQVRSTVWPARVEAHGALEAVRLLGTRARSGRLEVLLAVEHERGVANALIAFSADGLELLEWNGPAFFAAARLELQEGSTFLLELAVERPKVVFELAGGKIAALRLAGQRLLRK